MNNSIPRIRPPVYFLIAIALMILLNSVFPLAHWLKFPWKYFGIVFIILGFALTYGSFILFRQAGTQTHPGVKATVLVHKGPYRYTRNPMYVGLVVILLGVAILLGSLSPFLVIPIMIWILHSKFILREEKWMESWFGESYLEYKKKTRRWL
ncbi:isoprenylcysteine carboxylmethyltransferase family protein [Chitinophagaceae bacterium LB-8]|uniref:Isoprenylcysteine carboxylmethyltransferase family protein n=1 Tax=Paraflavisolibacter caeni TaxID=2982496 RepID=A0A9X2XNY8_9BACT|nr:isoprenylcysteine carboxylmethyltransferase family protein [Paraflavisolibacter caeni]MCU7549988.1 isoprenylcysteine carboxylmethyltransferase family protein [Paraflavisolibacter caeni]